MMIVHSYVPEAFGCGVIIPIIKDKRGDYSSLENYRPITLSPVISKLFESLLLNMYSKYMNTDDLQFGFKKSLSCSTAIFVPRQTIDFFYERGSNVYIASLDASKAFDRIRRVNMFSAFIKKSLPKEFINVICN